MTSSPAQRGSCKKCSDMKTEYFCKSKITNTEIVTVRVRAVYRSSFASLWFPFVVRVATQRDSASSMPADVREKHKA